VLDLERAGNAAFLGRVQAEVQAPDGRVLGRAEDNFAVYRRLRFRVAIPLGGAPLPAGATVRYRIDTERRDLPREGPLPARPVENRVSVR
jgi:hypothetical protein